MFFNKTIDQKSNTSDITHITRERNTSKKKLPKIKIFKDSSNPFEISLSKHLRQSSFVHKKLPDRSRHLDHHKQSREHYDEFDGSFCYSKMNC